MLTQENCSPLKGEEYRLDMAAAAKLLGELGEWSVDGDGKALSTRYNLKSYKRTVERVNEIAALAKEQKHHPDVKFGFGYVEVSLTTHDVGGLSRNDFIMAAKIDALFNTDAQKVA